MAFDLGSSSQSRQSGSLFGSLGQNTNQQPQQPSAGPFGGWGSSAQQSQQQSGGLFSTSSQQAQQSGGLFSSTGQSTQQPQQQPSGLFVGVGATTQQKPSLFGGLQSSQPQPQQQMQQPTFGQTVGQQVRQQPPTLQLGQSQQKQQGQQALPSLWEEGRGLGVYRTIPSQVMTIKDKWDPSSLASPLRTYLYQVVDEQNAPFYQPDPGEDEQKWEEAVSKRPGPGYVPALARGFWDLGKRAQRQREFIEKINIRLHEINRSLEAQLEIHSQQVASRLTECRRKHVVIGQRTLALAAKVQILRNRGYVMDNAEDELKLKLSKLEKEVLNPSLHGREQEIWARMLGIRERGSKLQAVLEKSLPLAKNENPLLDEGTVQAAKKALEAYDVQLRHLQGEVNLVSEEYEEWNDGPVAEVTKASVRI